MISLTQARRIALAAQGFGRSRPAAVTMRHFQGVIDRLGIFQIDSVNVVARAHLLPVYSRLGGYDTALFTKAGSTRPPRLVEFWAHEAALVPPSTWGLLAARRARYRNPSHTWGSALAQQPELVQQVLALVALRPRTARDIHEALGHERVAKTNWSWQWSKAKLITEALFSTGHLAVAHRTAQFERCYDLPERVFGATLPEEPDADQAALALVRIAAKALGIGTVKCLADYFRMRTSTTKAALEQLIASGEVIPATVSGWHRPAYLWAEAARPRKLAARALLAPFDPLVWERTRLLELFGMHYRLSIYTPAEKRTHGYYVLPFLLGDSFAARVDLKADHASSTLLVRTAFAEEDARPDTAQQLAAELSEFAQWLHLGRITIADEPRGDLITALSRHL